MVGCCTIIICLFIHLFSYLIIMNYSLTDQHACDLQLFMILLLGSFSYLRTASGFWDSFSKSLFDNNINVRYKSTQFHRNPRHLVWHCIFNFRASQRLVRTKTKKDSACVRYKYMLFSVLTNPSRIFTDVWEFLAFIYHKNNFIWGKNSALYKHWWVAYYPDSPVIPRWFESTNSFIIVLANALLGFP